MILLPAIVAAYLLLTTILVLVNSDFKVTRSDTRTFCCSSPAEMPAITGPMATSPQGVETRPVSIGQREVPKICRPRWSFVPLEIRNYSFFFSIPWHAVSRGTMSK